MVDWREHVRRALGDGAMDSPQSEDVVAEVAQHLEQRYRQSLAEGAAEEDARARALDELTGGVSGAELVSIKRARMTRLVGQDVTAGALRGIGHDFLYACRTLRRDLRFALIVGALLALGIAANGAVFSVVHAVLLRQLPYAESDSLVMVWESRPQEGVYDNVVSPADFLDWRAREEVFDAMAAHQGVQPILSGEAGPERIVAGNVSADFFATLGVAPMLGRDFTSAEEQAGGNRVVILSHGAWQRRFGGNSSAVGTSITLDGELHEIIGVLPQSFRFTDEAIELWYPIDFTREDMRARFNHFLYVIARLKEGVTVDRAQENMDVISSQLQQEVELRNQGHGAHVISLREQLVGDVRPALLVLVAAVGAVLLLVCVNVASLLLARGAARGKELAIRSALGAGRARTVRQLVVEGLVLAVVAAIAAVPLAMWGTSLLKTLVPTEVPRLNDAAMNPVVIGFMIAVALATAVLFSAAPALQVSQLNLVDALKENAASGGQTRRRMRRALVIAEIALAFVLLAGAGLMTRTLVNLVTVDAGFESANVLTAPLSIAGTDNANTQALAASFEALLDTLQAQPGVDSVGFTSHVPMGGNDSRIGIAVEGYQPDTDEPVRAHWRVITPGYFAAMQIRLADGRFPTAAETRDRASVAVINRTAAERYWRGTNPIGQRVRVLTPEWREVIGVVDDVLHWGPASPANPEIYLPGFRTPTNLVVRALPNASVSAGAIRDEIGKIAPESALASFRTMEDIRGQSVAAPRFYLLLLGTFACVGLMLAVVGVYAVISHGVAQSRHDIGIRMALGARGTDVARMFVEDGVALTGAGIALGALGAFAVTRVMASLLFGVSATDLSTFISVALVMAVTALAACYMPARRAASMDPLVALRQD